MTDVTYTADQVYLQAVLEKFNNDPNDPELTDIERILLNKITDVHKNIYGKNKEIEQLNVDITEKRNSINEVNKQIIHLQGQSQAYLESLMAARK